MRGLSRALAAWLRITGRGGAVLVANSTGCQVVVDMAAHAPDLLGPVVLNGPTMDRHARTAARQGARLLMNSRFEPPSLGVVIASDYLRCGLRRYLATLRHKLADPIEHKLPLVASPAIVVRGDRDPIVPREWAVEVAELLPFGRLVEVPGAGHTLNYSAPDELAQITRSLVKGERAPQGKA